jgi:hypothetical protein
VKATQDEDGAEGTGPSGQASVQGEGAPTGVSDDSVPFSSDSQQQRRKGCRVVYGAAPLPGALTGGGRFSFGGVAACVCLMVAFICEVTCVHV